MKGSFALLVCAAALAVCGAPLGAQAALPTVGEIVRLQLRSGESISGRVAYVSGDTLRVRTEVANDLAFTRQNIQSYSTVSGRDRWKGARVGAVVGAAVGVGLVVAGLIWESRSSENFLPSYAITGPGAVLTTGLGAGIGALIAPPQWSPQIQLGLDRRQDSQHRRVGLGFSRPFEF